MVSRDYMRHLIMATTNVWVKILQGDLTNRIYICMYKIHRFILRSWLLGLLELASPVFVGQATRVSVLRS